MRGEDVPLGAGVIGCAYVVATGTGAAAAVAHDGEAVRAAVREPGGALERRRPVAGSRGLGARGVPATAVSDRGDVLVAWSEDARREGSENRIRVARRAPGERGFGPAQVVQRRESRPVDVAGRASRRSGEAFVLWTMLETGPPPHRLPVRVAIAPSGAPFGPPAEVGRVPLRSTPALAVGADGRALVAIPDNPQPLGHRTRARRRVRPAQPRSPRAPDAFGASARAALGPTGEAVVTWVGRIQGGAGVASRGGPGPFTGVTLAEPGALGRARRSLLQLRDLLPRHPDGLRRSRASASTCG